MSVFNTGSHIPEENLDQVWDKFFKVDKARTREYGGSGVGLSIVRAIMESFQQQFGVRNVENGVEFWFELDYAGSMSESFADAARRQREPTRPFSGQRDPPGDGARGRQPRKETLKRMKKEMAEGR